MRSQPRFVTACAARRLTRILLNKPPAKHTCHSQQTCSEHGEAARFRCRYRYERRRTPVIPVQQKLAHARRLCRSKARRKASLQGGRIAERRSQRITPQGRIINTYAESIGDVIETSPVELRLGAKGCAEKSCGAQARKGDRAYTRGVRVESGSQGRRSRSVADKREGGRCVGKRSRTDASGEYSAHRIGYRSGMRDRQGTGSPQYHDGKQRNTHLQTLPTAKEMPIGIIPAASSVRELSRIDLRRRCHPLNSVIARR